jgi:hypothetical protein
MKWRKGQNEKELNVCSRPVLENELHEIFSPANFISRKDITESTFKNDNQGPLDTSTLLTVQTGLAPGGSRTWAAINESEMADGTNEINVCSRPGLENENELHENFRPSKFISESTFTFSKPVSLDSSTCPSDVPRISAEKSRASVGPIMSASSVNTFLNRDSESEFNQDPISSESVPISTLSALLTQSLSVLSGGVDYFDSLNGRLFGRRRLL